MSRKRGSGLETLMRLRRHRVQEIGRELVDLDAAIRRHESDKRALAETRFERADQDLPEAARFTADFVRHAGALLRAQEAEIEKLEETTREAQAQLRDAFIDLKRIELTHKAQQARERRQRDRRETQVIEEQTLMRWGRDD